MSGESDLSINTHQMQDYPMASLKKEASILKANFKKTTSNVNGYEEELKNFDSSSRQNSEKRQSFTKKNLAINIPLDEYPKN